MIKPKRLIDHYDFEKYKLAEGNASISYSGGLCVISSDVDILGIELDFKGRVEITPQLPENWIMQGNRSKILMFALQNVPITNSELFTYKGSIEIIGVLVANKDGKKILASYNTIKPEWHDQYWALDTETNNWDSFEDKTNLGKVSKTTYNLPDYNLPKVKKIKKPAKRKTTKRTIKGRTGGY